MKSRTIIQFVLYAIAPALLTHAAMLLIPAWNNPDCLWITWLVSTILFAVSVYYVEAAKKEDPDLWPANQYLLAGLISPLLLMALIYGVIAAAGANRHQAVVNAITERSQVKTLISNAPPANAALPRFNIRVLVEATKLVLSVLSQAFVFLLTAIWLTPDWPMVVVGVPMLVARRLRR